MQTQRPIFQSLPKLTTNRVLYTAFMITGLVELLIGNGLNETVSFFGIALIFDPFDTTMEWSKRPTYQKVWLITHVTVVIGAFIFMIAARYLGLKG